ncbi:sodium- and chloride-dependent betaine transporter [Plakobranchus ocellatus]|uniref:Sodium- and chloride-dependent betaine transporter n=1 Tax=Plakobranchus ocellatus TaxID=259542 RepID=A0AAV4DIV5_9GAST|nr:sodium- and chloride-dependent betaine transporter [Plakobranchus ocellatus]
MAKSFPHGTLHPYPNQGNPVTYSAFSGRASTGECPQMYLVPDIHEHIGDAVRTPTWLSYADDIVLWQHDTDIDKATEAINKHLSLLKRFCERWKMQINTNRVPILELVAGCEPLGLRQGEQTVLAQERYLRTSEGAPLGSVVEEFATQSRRIKKAYECELMAVIECLQVIIRRQRIGAALPGLVIFTDCRALVEALGGSGSESFGGAVLLADYLLKTEGFWTVVQ